MSARTWWRVKYLKMVEEEMEVNAESAEEAEREAKNLDEVARILEVSWLDLEEGKL